jgi:hypothetical protein
MSTRMRTDSAGRSWVPAVRPHAKSWRDVKWRPEGLLEGDRPGEYELEYRVASPGDTADTGWYLYGGGLFGEYMARRLEEAIAEAGAWIDGSVYGTDRLPWAPVAEESFAATAARFRWLRGLSLPTLLSVAAGLYSATGQAARLPVA